MLPPLTRRRVSDLVNGVRSQSRTDGTKYMFVGTPRQGFCNMFGRSTRARGDTICYRDVSLGGLHSNRCHVALSMPGQIQE